MEQIPLETISCPICDGEQFSTFIGARDRLESSSIERFQVVQCLRCSFKYTNPRPSENTLPVFYMREGYDPFVSLTARKSPFEFLYSAIRILNLGWKSKIAARWAGSGGRVLDLGCGTGDFLKRLKKNGWQTYGIEADKRAAEFGREKLGIDILTGSIDSIGELPDSFDLVTMWHSLEHMPDLNRTLKLLHPLLTDNSYMLIAIPNCRSLDALIYRDNWVAYDLPRHLYHFDHKSMAKVLNKHKFRVIGTVPMPFEPFYNSLLSASMGGGNKIFGFLKAGVVSILSLLLGNIVLLYEPSGSLYIVKRQD